MSRTHLIAAIGVLSGVSFTGAVATAQEAASSANHVETIVGQFYYKVRRPYTSHERRIRQVERWHDCWVYDPATGVNEQVRRKIVVDEEYLQPVTAYRVEIRKKKIELSAADVDAAPDGDFPDSEFLGPRTSQAVPTSANPTYAQRPVSGQPSIASNSVPRLAPTVAIDRTVVRRPAVPAYYAAPQPATHSATPAVYIVPSPW